ncbi:hypothetical protein OZX67_07190 [Bifidobacterium sp. ESL0728]|uniref:hypothetical protein n=1 Tax=Bifidobacterium sp. ESL0728 TaxID=2983220 RepID=UPI0023F62179|nr:hypothetical protein [Bifidobacterium sp. ESL0728]WEV58582.1 hypothetical protein OZX67_07190 [Bifidobacterium sp. ESL0728]
MRKTKQQLRDEIDSDNQSAQRCSQAAQDAQNTVDTLTGWINGANESINYARNFKNGALKNLKDQNKGIMTLLKSLGDDAVKGIGDVDACSGATNISNGNKGTLDYVSSQCDSIITRLQRQVDAWSSACTDAQNTVDSNNNAARAYSQAASSAQKQWSRMKD